MLDAILKVINPNRILVGYSNKLTKITFIKIIDHIFGYEEIFEN